MLYNHHVIAHGKALASCLSERRPLSDSKYKRTFLDYNLFNGKISSLLGHTSSNPGLATTTARTGDEVRR